MLPAEGLEHIEPGQVLASEPDRLVIKCGEGAVRLVDHELPRLPAARNYL